MNISRRDFLRGAAASTMGLAVSSVLPMSAMAEEAAPVSTAPAWLGEEPVIDESQIAETWDTDFLIVGAGNGGMMAASVAADYGIDFRVIEQNSVVCDTRHWYGAINTSAAKAAGVTVDVAKLRSEASRYTSGKMDQRVLNVPESLKLQ